jgi:hypothetical protein
VSMAVPRPPSPAHSTPRPDPPGRLSMPEPLKVVLGPCNAMPVGHGHRCNVRRGIVKARLRRRWEETLRLRGDRGPGRFGSSAPGGRTSRRCGAVRDDDVDGAAFVCPAQATGPTGGHGPASPVTPLQ